MKHPEKCDCPIHIQEDTTNVKYAAWAVIVVGVVLFLATVGCTQEENIIGRYECSKEQMTKAESETTYCKHNTSFYSTYCYQTAIQRNCVPKARK